MEVPSSADGVVENVSVKVGDKVSEGTPIVTLALGIRAIAAPAAAPPAPAEAPASAQPQQTTEVELRVPDIGDFSDIPVIEVAIKPGDRDRKRSAARNARKRKSVDGSAVERRRHHQRRAGQGRRQSLRRHRARYARFRCRARAGAATSAAVKQRPVTLQPVEAATRSAVTADSSQQANTGVVHASPAIRRFARELGVDLHGVTGSGPNGRVTREDVQRCVKSRVARARARRSCRRIRNRRIAGVAESRFRAIRRDRTQAASAHQEVLGPESAPQLAADSAHHELRRSGHHRARSLPQRNQRGAGEEPRASR